MKLKLIPCFVFCVALLFAGCGSTPEVTADLGSDLNADSSVDSMADSNRDAELDQSADITVDSATDLKRDKMCFPDCSGRVCGPDLVCGISCGLCAAPQTCDSQGQCGMGSSWIISTGGPVDDRGYGIAVDANGNAYVTGWFEGQVAFGNTTLSSAGAFDVFVAKVSAASQFVWATSFGGAQHDGAYA
ncbi:MAG: SBBP repeat-containing protein, partial [Pseudomonadota bacterium]